MLTRFLFLSLFALIFCVCSFSQSRHRFSTEETAEILLDRSKKENVRGFVTLGCGLVFSGVGLHLIKKEQYVFTPNSTGWSVSRSDNYIWGKTLLVLGTASAITSPFLFIHAGKLKRKAKLMLSDESTSLLNKKLSIPSVGIQVPF